MMNNCGECFQLSNFQCYWCSALSKCSDAFDRQRQEWITSGCVFNVSGAAILSDNLLRDWFGVELVKQSQEVRTTDNFILKSINCCFLTQLSSREFKSQYQRLPLLVPETSGIGARDFKSQYQRPRVSVPETSSLSARDFKSWCQRLQVLAPETSSLSARDFRSQCQRLHVSVPETSGLSARDSKSRCQRLQVLAPETPSLSDKDFKSQCQRVQVFVPETSS